MEMLEIGKQSIGVDTRYAHTQTADCYTLAGLAARTVGLTLDELTRLLKNQFYEFVDYPEITVTEWIYLCDLLKLEFGSIQYGYCEYVHKLKVGEAISNGEYKLPLNKEAKNLLKFYKTDLKERRKSELRHYGSRLKRKVYWNYLKSDFKNWIKKTSHKTNFRTEGFQGYFQ